MSINNTFTWDWKTTENEAPTIPVSTVLSHVNISTQSIALSQDTEPPQLQCRKQNKCDFYNWVIDKNGNDNQKCGGDNKGGSDCASRCCAEQNAFCRRQMVADMSYYFRCMRERGCDDHFTCAPDDGTRTMFDANVGSINYDVEANNDDRECYSYYHGGNQCGDECCQHQVKYCKRTNSDIGIHGFFECTRDRSCFWQAMEEVHGKKTCPQPSGTEWVGEGGCNQTAKKDGDLEAAKCNWEGRFRIEPFWTDNAYKCGGKYQGGAVCDEKCCKGQHEHCHDSQTTGTKHGYFECMEQRNCTSYKSCDRDGEQKDYGWGIRNKLLNYEVNKGIESTWCGKSFQGGETCKAACCITQWDYCRNKAGITDVHTLFDCMAERNCLSLATEKITKNDDGMNSCNTGDLNFHIDTKWTDSNYFCGGVRQGGSACNSRCVRKQVEHCQSACTMDTNPTACLTRCTKERKVHGSLSCVDYTYDVKPTDEQLCGEENKGGLACKDLCCSTQWNYCQNNASIGAVPTLFDCMEDRGCFDYATTEINGPIETFMEDGEQKEERRQCNVADKFKFTVESNANVEYKCGGTHQGNDQCKEKCCKRQHEHCHDSQTTGTKHGYFECMRQRNCTSYRSCDRDGEQKDYGWGIRNKLLNYEVNKDIMATWCGTSFQGGETCKAACCITQWDYCRNKAGITDVHTLFDCMAERNCLSHATAEITKNDSCNTGDLNFHIDTKWTDSNYFCGGVRQGGSACKSRCVRKQIDHCSPKTGACASDTNPDKCLTECATERKVQADLKCSDYSFDVKPTDEHKCGGVNKGGDKCYAACCRKQGAFCGCGHNDRDCMSDRGCSKSITTECFDADGNEVACSLAACSGQQKTNCVKRRKSITSPMKTVNFTVSENGASRKSDHWFAAKCKGIGASCSSTASCAGYGLLTTPGTACCKSKCKDKRADWFAAYYCPHEAVCWSQCCSDADCTSGSFCSGGSCKAKKKIGSVTGAQSFCSGHKKSGIGGPDVYSKQCKSGISCWGRCSECEGNGDCSGGKICRKKNGNQTRQCVKKLGYGEKTNIGTIGCYFNRDVRTSYGTRYKGNGTNTLAANKCQSGCACGADAGFNSVCRHSNWCYCEGRGGGSCPCGTPGGSACSSGGGGGGCLGSENVLLTDRGTIQLKNLKVGDRVLTRDGKWEIVWYIRDHGFTPVPHLRLTFSDGATVILTGEHLLYDDSDNLVRADAVLVGDVVSGGETIVNIEPVLDIPLTPCVVNGVIDIGGKSISCWSHNVENAKKMEALCRQVQDAMDEGIPINVIAKMAHNVYEKYHASGKDLSVMHDAATLEKHQYFDD